MTDISPEEKKMSRRIAEAQLDKLHLEITALIHQNSWEARVTKFLPLVTVMTAVVGFVFGVYQFQAQQRLQQDRTLHEQEKERESREREQSLRVQESIRRNVDQVLHFTTDERLTIAQAIFILHDLDTLLGSNVNQRRAITQSFNEMISEDSNFANNPRHGQLGLAIINNWYDYSAYIKTEQEQLTFLLDRYIEGLGKLHEQKPKFYECVEYEHRSGNYVGAWSYETKEYRQFFSLVGGFQSLFQLLEDEEDKENFLRQFQESLCNPTLTKQLFKTNYTDLGRCSAKPKRG